MTPILDPLEEQFIAVMEELAAAIADGDARQGANCYTNNVVFYEPSTRFLLRSREEIYKLFGGDKPHKGLLQWHHLGFNLSTRVGFGEFTLNYSSPVHGIAIVQINEGKISVWREYYFDSALEWEAFIKDSAFPANCKEEINQTAFVPVAQLTQADFQQLLQQMARGWNIGDIEKVTNSFTQNAIFIELPEGQQYKGREALQAFFREKMAIAPMQMTWHHALLNEVRQLGIGEYTSVWNRNQLHGIVIVKVCSGKISHWREYQFPSERDWKDFVSESIILNRQTGTL